MKRFFTTSIFFIFLCFSLFAQQKKIYKPHAGKTYPRKPATKPTAKKTTNLPAPSIYRNTEEQLNVNGQWKGSFVDNTASFMGFGGERIDYVLELETHGSDVTGYSYTYFTDAGKRFYTICKLKGSINQTTKEIVVTEFERTRFNTPPDFSNCFQTHRLKYVKLNSENENLQGSWVPAPNQEGNCGYGQTTLSRKIIKRNIINDQKVYNPPVKKEQPFKDMNRQPAKKIATPLVKPVAKNQSKPVTTSKAPVGNNIKQTIPPQPKKDTTTKKEITIIKPPVKREEKIIVPDIKFEKRTNSLLKTIAIKEETFTVDFYDNGEIDGDTISVFFNGRLLLSHKMLTDKPLTLTLKFDPDKPVNELVMYAESLGTIPPNTALMVVHDGDDRYEARIESDLGRNGTIRFTHKPKSPD